MIVGKVVGSLVSTRKNDNLIGSKFMIVEPLEKMQSGQAGNSRIVAVSVRRYSWLQGVLRGLDAVCRMHLSMQQSLVLWMMAWGSELRRRYYNEHEY